LKLKREPIDGVLLLDKPIGISSNDALQKAKWLLNAEKAGHTGSLDPLASGMLPLCFGEATKFSRFLLEEKKCYQTVMRLGVTTTTGDSEGEVLAIEPVPTISEEILANMVANFQGLQQQIPPKYSAIKFQGQPLYKLARQGKEVVRQPRNIMISHLEVNDITEQDGILITLTIVCSTGTYIRTLVEDMGAYLGCGAHVIALRRHWVWPFQNHTLVTLAMLEAMPVMDCQKILLPMGSILSLLLPSIQLSGSAAFYLFRGQSVQVTAQTSLGEVALMTEGGEFIGVGEMQDNGRVVPRRLVQQKAPASVQEVALV
jgi:tRNA pseudouridine55 synthase